MFIRPFWNQGYRKPLRKPEKVIDEANDLITSIVENGDKVIKLIAGLQKRDDVKSSAEDLQAQLFMLSMLHDKIDLLRRGALNLHLTVEERTILVTEKEEIIANRMKRSA